MGNCDNFKKYLSDYFDGNIPQKLKTDLEDHLDNCKECRDLVQGLKITRSLLNDLPKVKASSDFDIRLRERIIETECGENSPFFNLLSSKMAVVSGAVVILVCVTFAGLKFGVFNKNNIQPNAAPAISNELPSINPNVIPVKNMNRSGVQLPNQLLTEKLSQSDTTSSEKGVNGNKVNQGVKYIKGK